MLVLCFSVFKRFSAIRADAHAKETFVSRAHLVYTPEYHQLVLVHDFNLPPQKNKIFYTILCSLK
jgi:hypothetical protein